MADERWNRIKSVFARASAATGNDRGAILDRECAGDAELRREVESLLGVEAGGRVRTGDGGRAAAPTVSDRPHEGPGTRIGAYKLLELVGEGGFGSVYMAEQDQPIRRRVALKLIKPGMDSRLVGARFEAERQALALMDHPHIARVLDGGVTDAILGARPYFVMEYVKGDPITKFADAHKLSVPDRLGLFTQVCEAVQHAHQKGIIHRDLKPSNVLVSMTDGRPFAKVIDFGIAKATGVRLTDKTLFTEHRQLIGTPEYMSPEQAEGSPDIDTRTDVYGLGVLLYELLTGETPFDAVRLRSAAIAEMQRILKEEDPPAPSLRLSRGLSTLAQAAAVRRVEPGRLGTLLKGELDWIVMKALDKDRARRYESPGQFAADIQRHLEGEAVIAAPLSMGYRVRKFARRNRGPVVVMGAVGAALMMGLVVSSYFMVVARGQRNVAVAAKRATDAALRDAQRAREQEAAALRDAQRQTYTANIFAARASLSDSQYPQARERLKRCPPDEQNFEWRFLRSESQAAKFALRGSFSGFSRDGKFIATVLPGGAARVWEAETGRELRTLGGQGAQFSTAEFSPDPGGRRVLTTSSYSAPPQVWEVSSGELVCTLGAFSAYSIPTFDPTGDRVIAVSHDGAARVCDAGTGSVLQTLTVPSNALSYARFSPDGRFIVTASSDFKLQVWDSATSRVLVELVGHTGSIDSACFNKACDRVLTTSHDLTARVWDVGTGREVFALTGHKAQLSSVEFSPDGERIVTSSYDGTARVWDAATGRQVSPTIGGKTMAFAARFSPDSAAIVTVSDNAIGRVWDAATGREVCAFAGQWHGLTRAEYSPDGRLIALCGDATTEVFAVESPAGARKRVWQMEKGTESQAECATETHRAIGRCPDSLVRLWNTDDGGVICVVMPEWDVESFVFSPDGKRFVAVGLPWEGFLASASRGSRPRQVWLFDAATGAMIKRLEDRASIGAACAFNAAGSRVATLSDEGEVHVWDTADGARAATLGPPVGQHDLGRLRFGPKDQCIVAENAWGVGVVWNLASGLEIARFVPPPSSEDYSYSSFVTFSEDGGRFIASSRNASAEVVDAETGVRLPLEGHVGVINKVEFSKDGRRIVTHDESTAQFWDAQKGTQVIQGAACSDVTFASSISFDPDGRSMAAVLADGVVGLFDAETGEGGAAIGRVLDRPGLKLDFLCFNADGSCAATCSEEGSVQLWGLNPLTYLKTWEKVGPSQYATQAAFGPGDSLVVFWGTQGKVLECKSGGGVAADGLNSPSEYFNVAFAAGGARVLARDSAGTILAAWDRSTGDELPRGLSEIKRGEPVLATHFNFDMSRLIVKTAKGVAILMDGAGKRVSSLWTTTKVEPVGAVSSDGSVIVTATGRDGRAQVWDVELGLEIARLWGHNGGVRSVGITPDGKKVVTGSYDNTAIVWQSGTGARLATFSGHGSSIGAVAISPDGSRVVTGSDDREVRLWDVSKPGHPVRLNGHDAAVRRAAFSPDGSAALTVSGDCVRLWNGRDGTAGPVLRHRNAINAAVFDPSGKLVATASDDGTARVWDAGTGEARAVIEVPGPARCVAFSAKGDCLLVGADGGWSRIVETLTGKNVVELKGHADAVVAAAFSPDGSRIVTGSRDRSMRLWDAKLGDELLPFSESGATCVQLWVTPDGHRIIGLMDNASIATWSSEPETTKAGG